MRLGIAVPERHVSKPVLDAALEATTRLDEEMIRSGAPTLAQAKDKVRWRPEPPGQENFDHLGEVLRRGAGDCDDLAPWHTASLRVTGKDPGAQSEVYPSGPGRWHAVTVRSDGRIEDPSKALGMGPGVSPFVAGVAGDAVLPPMVGAASVGAYEIAPTLAARPLPSGLWEARADLPWNYIPWVRKTGTEPLDAAMASLYRSPVASQAIVGACVGASKVLRVCDVRDPLAADECHRYLHALALGHGGASYRQIADLFGEEMADATAQSVGSLWGSLSKVVKKGGDILKSKPARFIAPVIPGAMPYVLATRGADAAVRSKGGAGNVLRAFGGGVMRGSADYLANPIVKEGAKVVPGMSQIRALAEKVTDSSAGLLEAQTKEEMKAAARKAAGNAFKAAAGLGGEAAGEAAGKAAGKVSAKLAAKLGEQAAPEAARRAAKEAVRGMGQRAERVAEKTAFRLAKREARKLKAAAAALTSTPKLARQLGVPKLRKVSPNAGRLSVTNKKNARGAIKEVIIRV